MSESAPGWLLRRLAAALPVSRRRLRRELEAQQRELAQLGEHVEAADRWIESSDRWRRSLGEGGEAGAYRERLPTPGLELGLFEDDAAGPVLGYRSGGAPPAGGQAGFADLLRGGEAEIRESQRPYLKLLEGQAPVLDLGCGRGELLDLLRDAGIEARGVDSDAAMAARCRAKGHDVTEAELSDHLAGLEGGSLGAVFSAQVVEHLPQGELVRLIESAREALRPDGLFIAETLNPHEPEALRNFWADPTHMRPLFPETLLALCHLAGYESAFVFHPGGSGDPEADLLSQPVYAAVASRGS